MCIFLVECCELVTNGLKLYYTLKTALQQKHQKLLGFLKESLKIKFPSCSACVNGRFDTKGNSDKEMSSFRPRSRKQAGTVT
jgi:hypothetical protein